MAKRSLIVYASMTGNTVKVAERFKQVFEKFCWECDIHRVEKGADLKNPPFDYNDYDFLCAGSPVVASLPVKDIIDILRFYPGSPHAGRFDIAGAYMEDIQKEFEKNKDKMKGAPQLHHKIVFEPDSRKGVVFVTFAGHDFGPKEAEASLSYLESEMEHMRFQCIGKFACPGRMAKTEGYFKDLPSRPNERDLLKAEIFLEEILESLE